MSFNRKIQTIKQLRQKKVNWGQIFLYGLDSIGFNTIITFLSDLTLPIIKLTQTHLIKRYLAKNKESSREIIVIETGVLGDCILVTGALLTLQKYCIENGYNLTIICSKKMSDFFRKFANIIQANFLTYSDRDTYSSKEVKKIFSHTLNKKYKFCIRRDSNPFALKLATGIIAENSLYYSYDIDLKSKITKEISKVVFTEIRNISDIHFIPQIWKIILERVGIKNYRTHQVFLNIPQTMLEKLQNFCPKNEYCVITPQASNRDRSIDIEKLKQIIHFLKTKKEYEIVISIDNKNPLYTEQVAKLVEEENIIGYLGNTNLDEFIVLLHYSSFVISCDTGAAHLAAHLKKKVIVLKGFWDLPYFLPYDFDAKNSISNPILIFPKKKPYCAYCGSRKKYAENPKCDQRLRSGFSVKCMNDIDNNDIFSIISEVINEISCYCLYN